MEWRKGGAGQIVWHMSKDVYVNSECPSSRGLPVSVSLMKLNREKALLMICNLRWVISL